MKLIRFIWIFLLFTGCFLEEKDTSVCFTAKVMGSANDCSISDEPDKIFWLLDMSETGNLITNCPIWITDNLPYEFQIPNQIIYITVKDDFEYIERIDCTGSTAKCIYKKIRSASAVDCF